MKFGPAIKQAIGHGHDGPPDSFLVPLIIWAKAEEDSVFEKNNNHDIFSIVSEELGPFDTLIKRKAVLCAVMIIIAGDESDWNWREGRDVTAGQQTEDQKEAGAFQVSNDIRHTDSAIDAWLNSKGIHTGLQFQASVKGDPILDCALVARVLRANYKRWDGPINRGWVEAQVKREMVDELVTLLS